jgi:hypothetical protein
MASPSSSSTTASGWASWTDLGHPFAVLRACLETLDAVYLESNLRPEMLAHGPYPRYLQERIRGRAGICPTLNRPADPRRGRQLKWAALAHLTAE